jgi:hypothetical protein
MQRTIFGITLFLFGGFGYLLISIHLSDHQYNYNGTTGLYADLLGNHLFVPFVLCCILGVLGLIICIYELYLRKLIQKHLQKYTDTLLKNFKNKMF